MIMTGITKPSPMSCPKTGKFSTHKKPLVFCKFMLVVLTFFLLVVPVSFAITNATLQMYYPMNDTSGPIRSAIGANGNLIVGSNTYGITGVIGTAINFTGTGSYGLNNTATITAANAPFGVSIWYKSTVTGAGVIWFLGEYGGETYGCDNAGAVALKRGATYLQIAVTFVANTDTNITIASINDGNWHNIIVSRVGDVYNFYIDGVWKDVRTISSVYAPCTATGGGARITINKQTVQATDGINAAYDEFMYFNTNMSQANVTDIYNSGSGWNPFPAMLQITYVSQVPSDLTSTNALVNNSLNITYNITTIADNSTVRLKWNYNSTQIGCFQYANGTCLNLTNTFINRSWDSVTVPAFKWQLRDNEVYPAKYGYPDQRYMETASKLSYNLTTVNALTLIKLENISNVTSYGWFEIDANRTTGNFPLEIYYCNSSYSTGSPDDSNNCYKIYDLIPGTANHTHGSNNRDYMIPFPVISGKSGLVTVTSTSYFLTKNVNPSTTWAIKYISNITTATYMNVSINSGSSWTSINGSFSQHLHQIGSTDQFCYQAFADGTSSALRCDTVNLDALAPTVPVITSPINQTYNNISFNITYLGVLSPNNATIINYNISLMNPDLSFNKSLWNNSLNLSWVWSTLTETDSNYSIRVCVYDNQSLASCSYSRIFNLDKLPPIIIFTYPVETNTTSISLGNSINLNLTAYDNNLYALEVIIKDNLGNMFQNITIEPITASNYELITLFYPNNIGTWTIIANASDDHTDKKIKNYLTSVTGNKLKFTDQTIDPSSKIKKSKDQIITYSGETLLATTTRKKEDRYTWSYKFDTKNFGSKTQLDHYITINCTDLRHVDSEYPAHFICWNDRKWIDFSSPLLKYYDYELCGNRSDCAIVHLTTEVNESISFESIGGLNFNSKTIRFTVTEAETPSDNILSVGVCPTTLSGILSLYLALALGIVIFFMGMYFRTRVISIFGCVIMVYGSLSLIGCNFWIGVIMTIVGLLLMIVPSRGRS